MFTFNGSWLMSSLKSTALLLISGLGVYLICMGVRLRLRFRRMKAQGIVSIEIEILGWRELLTLAAKAYR